MQAYKDGKKIQVKGRGGWSDCVAEPSWNWGCYSYRVKSEPKYCPYKNREEMIADFKDRFKVNVPDYVMPLIWVKQKGGNDIHLITTFPSDEFTLKLYFDHETYLDGSPIGKLVKE